MNSELNEAMKQVAQARADLAYAKAMRSGPFLERLHSNKSLYFAQCGDAIKIGVSSDPNVRIETLQTGAPGKVTLVAAIQKAGDKESECHRRLAHLRIHGEWFRYTEEIDQLIQELS